MTVEKQQLIDQYYAKSHEASNSYEKAMYHKMIEEEKNDICSHCHRVYDMVD